MSRSKRPNPETRFRTESQSAFQSFKEYIDFIASVLTIISVFGSILSATLNGPMALTILLAGLAALFFSGAFFIHPSAIKLREDTYWTNIVTIVSKWRMYYLQYAPRTFRLTYQNVLEMMYGVAVARNNLRMQRYFLRLLAESKRKSPPPHPPPLPSDFAYLLLEKD